MSLTLFYSGNKGAYTDSYSSEIGSFVNFDKRIHSAFRLHNLVNLVGSNRVKSASETCKLHKLKIRHFGNKCACTVKAVVIYPLVNDTQRTLNAPELCKTVFRKDRKSKSVYHFGNSVIYFRIYMIRAACKHNSVAARAYNLLKRILTRFLRVFTEFLLLRPCGIYSCIYLL